MGSAPSNISASRGAAILGMSEWTTPTDAWLRIMEERNPGFCERNNFERPERKDTPELAWGLAFEDAIIGLSESHQSDEIIDMERAYQADSDGVITCHIDGRYKKAQMLHEGKTTNVWSYVKKWGDPGTDSVPIDYQIQVQHQMMCTGVNECIISVLVFPKRQGELAELGLVPEEFSYKKVVDWANILDEMGYFHQYPVKANIRLQQEMHKGYMDFWTRNVLKQIAPAAKRYSDIRKLVRAPSGTIVANELLASWSDEYKAIGRESAQIAKRKDWLKTQLLERMKSMIPTDDDESAEKWILLDIKGRKLHSYDGKKFR
jgi:predicted phage-related endonuclease